MAKVALLNSGGLDSAMVAKWLKQEGHEVHSFHIETDCVNAAQQKVAAAQTAANYCASHFVFPFKFGMIPNHWEPRFLPADRAEWDAASLAFYPSDPPVRYVGEFADPMAVYAERPWQEFRAFPNQAMTFYGLGVTFAKIIGATEVYSGARLTQDNQYLLHFNAMMDESRLKVSRPQLVAPFTEAISYAQAVEIFVGHPPSPAEVAALQAEFAYTYSCRLPSPCGVCEKCTGRAAIGLV